jgi:hypothetical protein
MLQPLAKRAVAEALRRLFLVGRPGRVRHQGALQTVANTAATGAALDYQFCSAISYSHRFHWPNWIGSN